jgi:hypothetical protein
MKQPDIFSRKDTIGHVFGDDGVAAWTSNSELV